MGSDSEDAAGSGKRDLLGGGGVHHGVHPWGYVLPGSILLLSSASQPPPFERHLPHLLCHDSRKPEPAPLLPPRSRFAQIFGNHREKV